MPHLRRSIQLFSAGVRSRHFSTANPAYSAVDPSNPDEAHLYKIKPVGRLFKEPFDSKSYVLSREPLYEGPNTSQISFAKRWACGFSILGSYVGYLATGVIGITDMMASAGLISILLPLPLIHYFSSSYVSRVFRVYRAGLRKQTLDSMTSDETILVEKVGFFGRSTYGVPVKVAQTRLSNKRLGWVNWVYIDEMGRSENMYIEDNLGGMKMDRIWGIVEKNSGIHNTGRFPY